MPNWLRIVLFIALVLVLWWLVANLGRSVAGNPAATPTPEGSGLVVPGEARLPA